MSETILKILSDELETIQIICRTNNCNAVVELPVKALDGSKPITCPLCKSFLAAQQFDHLYRLAEAFAVIGRHKKEFQVQFILKQPSKSP